VLWRRRAPLWAFMALAGAGVAYGLALSWLRAQHLERTHLPEYGIAAWLAWRAIVPLVPAPFPSYATAALLAAAIGLGDELLQAITPGRVYDIRDVAMNALGAVLGMVVIAAVRAERASLSGGSSSRRSPRAAGS
jgi:VanZ like family